MMVCAAIINVYDSSVRNFGPIGIYTLFLVSNGSVKIKVRENSKPDTISNL